jgi:hypothetical protein
MKFLLNLVLAAEVVALLCLASGCNKSGDAEALRSTKVFDSADPVIKSTWEVAVSAAATNGYVAAILSCKKLQGRTDLTPEQREAVNAYMTTVTARMTAAGEKGDPDALKAVEELRARWRSG